MRSYVFLAFSAALFMFSIFESSLYALPNLGMSGPDFAFSTDPDGSQRLTTSKGEWKLQVDGTSRVQTPLGIWTQKAGGIWMFMDHTGTRQVAQSSVPSPPVPFPKFAISSGVNNNQISNLYPPFPSASAPAFAPVPAPAVANNLTPTAAAAMAPAVTPTAAAASVPASNNSISITPSSSISTSTPSSTSSSTSTSTSTSLSVTPTPSGLKSNLTASSDTILAAKKTSMDALSLAKSASSSVSFDVTLKLLFVSLMTFSFFQI